VCVDTHSFVRKYAHRSVFMYLSVRLGICSHKCVLPRHTFFVWLSLSPSLSLFLSLCVASAAVYVTKVSSSDAIGGRGQSVYLSVCLSFDVMRKKLSVNVECGRRSSHTAGLRRMWNSTQEAYAARQGAAPQVGSVPSECCPVCSHSLALCIVCLSIIPACL